jgi:hypothetical protein
MMATETRVVVSDHAAERAVDRLELEPSVVAAEVTRQVTAALEAGRRGCRKPRFLHPRGRRPRIAPGIRIAWDESESTAFVLRRTRGRDGRRVWLVVTCLVAEQA